MATLFEKCGDLYRQKSGLTIPELGDDVPVSTG